MRIDSEPGVPAPVTADVTALAVAEPGGSPVDAALPVPATMPATMPATVVEDLMDWSWPPYAPLEPVGGRRFDCAEWAPSSIVQRPLVRVGHWTLLYRRGA